MTRRFGAWGWTLLACVLIVGLADAVLLELGQGFFRTGYNSPLMDSAVDRAAFLALGAWLDATLVLGLWAVLLPPLRRVSFSGGQQFLLAVFVGTGLPLVLDVVRYRIHRVLGDVVDLGRLWALAGGSLRGGFAEMASQAPTTLILFGGAGLAMVLAVAMASPLERRLGLRVPAPPSGRRLATSFLVLLLPAIFGLVLVEQWAPRFAFGIARKPSGMILGRTVEFLTDFDRDGTGLLARPPDPAPFDPDIHPYALDIPGNGIDENGFAGDHPEAFRLPPDVQPQLSGEPPKTRPSLLLIFLESFRGDLLEARHDGRRVTPFLSDLARKGATTSHAYVHTPYSGPSREQLFSGRTAFEAGDGTLYQDFRGFGYEIAHFSGQDDTHANAVQRLALDEADVFYDARSDVDRRTSRSTASVSLQVSWKTLLGRVLDYLESRDDRRPLLLYVNIVDTHFPYDHDELDDLLGAGPLPRSAIHADNADGVRTAYMNAAANVDQAAEKLVDAWEAKMGPKAPILVTADHGQSFYERGMLGHGQSLGSAQTRVPFILRHVSGTWPEPLGLADVRGLLLRSMVGDSAEGKDEARFVADPGRSIFQILGRLERPALLGLRELEHARIYDMDSARVIDDRGMRVTDDSVSADRRRIILTWEAHRLQEAGMQRGPVEPSVHGASP